MLHEGLKETLGVEVADLLCDISLATDGHGRPLGAIPVTRTVWTLERGLGCAYTLIGPSSSCVQSGLEGTF
jgi:hypothetical protein